jgi:tetrapyrrole methylase family protein/MazG family protein
MSGITLLGLGPGDPSKLTREAWDVLATAKEVWLRTNQHPTITGFPATLKIHSFDELYENGGSFEDVYSGIVEKVMELGQSPQGQVTRL